MGWICWLFYLESVLTGWNQDYPKIQILTIAELLAGAEIKIPPAYGTFKQAQKVDDTPKVTQHKMDLD